MENPRRGAVSRFTHREYADMYLIYGETRKVSTRGIVSLNARMSCPGRNPVPREYIDDLIDDEVEDLVIDEDNGELEENYVEGEYNIPGLPDSIDRSDGDSEAEEAMLPPENNIP
ncbi:unnamed protein product, partial [Parnassius apollo]